MTLETNPLEPQGCAACDRGEGFTEGRAYIHTGFGKRCRGRELTRPPPRDAPTPRAPLSVTRTPGTRACSNCGKPGHYAKTCPNDAAPIPEAPTMKQRTCTNCHQPGHYAKTCKEKKS